MWNEIWLWIKYHLGADGVRSGEDASKAMDKTVEPQLLEVPSDVTRARARLYIPATFVGLSTNEEITRAVERFLVQHPSLRGEYERERGEPGNILSSLLGHAHAVSVLELNEERFTFRPLIPYLGVRGDLMVGTPLSITIQREPGKQIEEEVGFLVVLCLSSDTPLVPASTVVGMALRRYVEKFFESGLLIEPNRRIGPGERFPAPQAARAVERISKAMDSLRLAHTSFAAGDQLVEVPRRGSVLLLGPDGTGPGWARLQSLRKAFLAAGYRPLLIRDFPDFEHSNVMQKVAAVALSAHHVVVDDSESSGHLVEVSQILVGLTIPFVVLRSGGLASTAMIEPVIASYRWSEIVSVAPADEVEAAIKASDRLGAMKVAAIDRKEWWRSTPK